MKKKIHPQYFTNATIKCACGHTVVAGSTIKEQKTDICGKCHPFYTGKQKLIDTAGRVDKFRAKVRAYEDLKANKTAEKTTGKGTKKEGKYMTMDEINKIKEKETKKAEKRSAKKGDTKKTETAKKTTAKAKKSTSKKTEKK